MDVYMALIHGNEVLPLASGDNPPTSIRLPKSHEVNETEFFVYVPERTCHDTWDCELTGRLRFQCSECGAVSLEITPRFCPNCGAKVEWVGE